MTAPRLSPDRLAEIEARLQAATPGPWQAVEGASGGWWIEQPYRATIAEIDIDHMTPAADAELIAHAPTDIADLLAALAASEAALAAMTVERDDLARKHATQRDSILYLVEKRAAAEAEVERLTDHRARQVVRLSDEMARADAAEQALAAMTAERDAHRGFSESWQRVAQGYKAQYDDLRAKVRGLAERTRHVMATPGLDPYGRGPAAVLRDLAALLDAPTSEEP